MTETLNSVIDKLSTSIIDAVKREFHVDENQFRTSRLPRHVRARAEAINRLSTAGFGPKAISRAMRIDVSMVDYWLHPKERARRRASRIRLYHEVRA